MPVGWLIPGAGFSHAPGRDSGVHDLGDRMAIWGHHPKAGVDTVPRFAPEPAEGEAALLHHLAVFEPDDKAGAEEQEFLKAVDDHEAGRP